MNHARSEVEQEARADLTPMIDAVFLLVIFFLCIDFRTLEAKLPAHLPKEVGSSPVAAPPVDQLALGIICDEFGERHPRRAGAPAVDPVTGRDNPSIVVGHRVHWSLGPRRFDDLATLVAELDRIAADPARRVPDPDAPGTSTLVPVVIEPGPGTTYGDTALTVDAVLGAGFDQVRFGGGRGTRPR